MGLLLEWILLIMLIDGVREFNGDYIVFFILFFFGTWIVIWSYGIGEWWFMVVLMDFYVV